MTSILVNLCKKADGFGVLLCDCEEDTSLELTMLDVLDEKRVDGVIVVSPRTSTEKLLPNLSDHPNVVLVNRLFEVGDVPVVRGYVMNNDKTGGYIAWE